MKSSFLADIGTVLVLYECEYRLSVFYLKRHETELVLWDGWGKNREKAKTRENSVQSIARSRRHRRRDERFRLSRRNDPSPRRVRQGNRDNALGVIDKKTKKKKEKEKNTAHFFCCHFLAKLQGFFFITAGRRPPHVLNFFLIPCYFGTMVIW